MADFCPANKYFLLPSIQVLLPPPKMSSSKSVLQSEITSLKSELASARARIDELTVAAAAAPAARSKKEKKPADHSKPRMLSPYLVFCAAKRAESVGTPLKAADLGEMWKLLSADDKAKYVSVPVVPKPPKEPKRAKKAAAADADGVTETPAKKAKKDKKPRDPDAPKKPLTGFMLYSQQERAKSPDVKIKAPELAERWRALSDDERAAYKSS